MFFCTFKQNTLIAQSYRRVHINLILRRNQISALSAEAKLARKNAKKARRLAAKAEKEANVASSSVMPRRTYVTRNGTKTQISGPAEVAQATANTALQTTNNLQAKVDRLTAAIQKRDARINKVHVAARENRKLNGVFMNAAGGESEQVQPSDADYVSGHSGYLHSLLIPEDGACSIPDDVTRLHSIRSETTTVNLTMLDPGAAAVPVSGLMILYPNHPTNLVGYNYIWNSVTGNYVFDQILTVAQNLSESYDYGRRTSQLLSIICNSIPSGVYALSGTINAVRVDGMLSELDLFADRATLYTTLLADTTNLFDKIGNVRVGDGLAVLSLPDTFINPYTRFNDTIPTSMNAWASIEGATIVDSSQDLLYKCELGDSGTGMSTSPQWTFDMNVDSTTGFQYDVSFGVSINVTAACTYYVTFDLTVYDVFTNLIGSVTKTGPTLSYGGGVGGNYSNTFSGFWDPVADSLSGNDVGPVAAISIVMTIFYSAVPTATGWTSNMVPMIRVPLGARPGVNQSITLVAYQNLPPQAQLTVGGVTNYELIPNPELRKNLETTYGKYDPQELETVKYVMCNRRKFELRSVMSLKEYDKLKDQFRALAKAPHQALPEISGALTWNDVKRLGKKVLPFISGGLKFLAPEAAPVINGLTSVFSNAATGSPRMHAASKEGFKFVMPQRKSLKSRRVLPIKPKLRGAPSSATLDCARAVAFPCLQTNADNDVLGFGLYVAVPGKVPGFDGHVAKSVDGFSVYGLFRPSGIQFPIGCDQTLVRIDPDQFPKLVPQASNEVYGTSCDAALWICGHADFSGVYPVAITGEVKPGPAGPMVIKNEYFEIKQALCSSHGVILIGRDPMSKIDVENLREFSHIRSDFPKLSRVGVRYYSG